jgi:hypothetical protein
LHSSSPTAAAPAPRGPRRFVQLALAAWIAAQCLLPLRCFLADPLDHPPRFCWNMYSYRASCQARYLVIRADGSMAALNPFSVFERPTGAFTTFHRDALPSFHGWLCAALASREPGARLEGEVSCASAGHDDRILVRRGVDLCAAERFGVLSP